MPTGLDDFKLLLKEFRGLSVWAVAGSLVVPFAADLADLSPPWPPGIVPVTAIVELLALVLTFQFFKASKRRVNRVLLLSVGLFALFSIVYLGAFSYFTFSVKTKTGEERYVKGYECTSDAQMVFKDKCPDLGLDELKTASYSAERLWTRRSIAIVRVGLAVVWSIVFIALSFALGNFLQYQMGRKKRGKGSAGRRKRRADPKESLEPPPDDDGLVEG